MKMKMKMKMNNAPGGGYEQMIKSEDENDRLMITKMKVKWKMKMG